MFVFFFSLFGFFLVDFDQRARFPQPLFDKCARLVRAAAAIRRMLERFEAPLRSTLAAARAAAAARTAFALVRRRRRASR